jgi:hypothetical protein
MGRVWLLAAVALTLNVAATPAAPEHSARAQSVYIEDLTWPEVKAAIATGKTTAIIYARQHRAERSAHGARQTQLRRALRRR